MSADRTTTSAVSGITHNDRPHGSFASDPAVKECITEAYRREHRELGERTTSFQSVDEAELLMTQKEIERTTVLVDHWGNQWVCHESNNWRIVWTVLVSVCLAYTGTIFLYQLTFIELHLPQELDIGLFLNFSTILIDVIFYIDLLANFFFSYRGPDNIEVDGIRPVFWNYLLTGQFFVNFFACLPPQLFESIFSGSTANKASRIVRLQRLSKLFRLVKLRKILSFLNMPRVTKLMKKLANFRSLRIFNFVIFLFWFLHLLACGWYLTAVFTDEPEKTWLARRVTDSETQTTLLQDDAPLLQWLHSMYFVMTLFTTVGFGDIAAMTELEVIYCLFAFIVGTIINGIVMGEVINTCIKEDEVGAFVSQQKHLVESFAIHLQVDPFLRDQLVEWVETESPAWLTHQYDRDAMKELVQGRYMSRELMIQLPHQLFQGELAKNNLFTQLCDNIEVLPPRFPIIFALASHYKNIEAGEFLYQKDDLANIMFLVISGTFAHIGIPTPEGGRDVRFLADRAMPGLYPYQLFSRRSYFGDEMLMSKGNRVATLRCEKRGATLVVERKELHGLKNKFPDFADVWRKESYRREGHRQQLVKKLIAPHNYRFFAAITIQRYFRLRLVRSCVGTQGNSKRVSKQSKRTTVGKVAAQSLHKNIVSVVNSSRFADLDSDEHLLNAGFLPSRRSSSGSGAKDMDRSEGDIIKEIRLLRADMELMRVEMQQMKNSDAIRGPRNVATEATTTGI